MEGWNRRIPILPSFAHSPTAVGPSNLFPSFTPLHVLSLCLEFYSPGLTDNFHFFLRILLSVDSSIVLARILSPLKAVDNEEFAVCLLRWIVCFV